MPINCTELERLRGAISQKLDPMNQLNRQRMDYQEQFETLIEEYKCGSANTVQASNSLKALAQALTETE